MDEERISQEDMDLINAGKGKVELAVALAEKFAAQARVADLEYRSVVQHIFIKYCLRVEDSINDVTGQIVRKPASIPTPEETANEPVPTKVA